MELKNKVAIYTRVSTVYQIDKDSLAIQKKDLISYAEIILGIKDYEVFEDAGYSGKDTDRPAYKNMMQKMESGEFSHLLVWKIDRVSRNLLDFSEMYSKLKSIGVIFISRNEQFDTSSAIGEAMLKIILVFAELERKMTSERVTAAMLSRASDGKWNGGTIPYGYDYDKETKEITINDKEAKVIRRMFALYEETHSTLATTKHLNTERLLTRSGKEWQSANVYRLLTNPFISGCYVYNISGANREIKPRSEWIVFENHHPAIIPKATQDYIIDLLHSKRIGTKNSDVARAYKHIHVFSDILFCGSCNSKFSGYMGKSRVGGFKPSDYRCIRRFNYGTICNNKYTSDAYVGPFIFGYVSNLIKLSTNYDEKLFDDEIFSRLINNKCFKGITGLTKETYRSIRKMSARSGADLFNPSWMFESAASDEDNEPARIKAQILKDETALNRLNSLYLYGSEEMNKADYLQNYKKITSRLEEANKRLSEFGDDALELSLNKSTEFAKASYVLLIKELASDEFFDYKKYAVSVDPMVTKKFLKTIIKKIVIVDAQITSITFANDETHEFIYEE